MKEACFATADAVQKALGVTLEEGTLPNYGSINIVSLLAISKDNAAKVHVLLDQNLPCFWCDKTVFIHYEKLNSYLDEAQVKVALVEFTAEPFDLLGDPSDRSRPKSRT